MVTDTRKPRLLGTIAALYAIAVGFIMIGVWSGLLAAGQVPELMTDPIEFSFHLIAEGITAVVLLVGGFGMFTRQRWALRIYLLGMGLLLYATLAGLGFHAQQGEQGLAGMFGILFLLTVFFTAATFTVREEHAPVQGG